MNQEMIDILVAIYRFEIVKALYDQRIIAQDNYKEYLMNIAEGIIDIRKENNGGNDDGK